MSKKKRQSLIEQRENIQNTLKKALADNDFKEYDKLYNKFMKINKKIRTHKKEGERKCSG